ncbi:MAG: TAXI family TRAP transporter solute-binding subunit [Marinosulfonomonas sp.]|nr:TAXI family TRAP transporter solute-binding subunit [Marinosulfonomonas sp.]
MNISNIRAIGLAAISSLVVATSANAEIYKGETAGAGGSTHVMFVAFANQARKAGVDIQVNAGQTMTKAMLNSGRGNLDFYSGVPGLVALMAGGKAMYTKVENAPEMAANLRSIVGFKAGMYHVLTKAGSGVENWSDIAGRKVYLGPPSGSASVTSATIIKIMSGLEVDKDYTGIKLSWGEGLTALADDNVDVLVQPGEVGSAQIQQFGLSGEFRLLSITDEKLQDDEMKGLLARPGRGLVTFPGSVYEGQLTEGDVNGLGFFQFVGTHVGMSEDVIYAATKAFWENLDDVHATANFLKDISRETAFVAVNAPLHKGAYRYYKEAGFDVPESLIPPQ